MANETAQKNLIVEEQAGLVTLTMNRPEKRNALSTAMMTELTAELRAIGKRVDSRAVIIAGIGPAFSAGHDLGELKGRDLAFYRYEFDLCAQLMQTIQAIPQPVIARVHAIATAAGCQLAAACDLVVAGERASFATPGVRIGLFCSTPMVALTRAVGRKHAMEMLLTGQPVNAHTAAEWGLVNRVVADAELVAETRKLAMQIVEASSLIIGIGKQAFYAQIDLDTAHAYDYTKEVMSQNAMASDAQEGIGAFLEKRKPVMVRQVNTNKLNLREGHKNMELRRILGIIAGATGILLVGSLPASAKDLCFTFGSHVFFTSVSIPSKGQCEPFSLAAKAPYAPGYLATGSMCLSSSGTTVLLNLTTGYFDGTESIQGTFSKNTGAGTVSDCIAPDGAPNKCSTSDFTATTCATQSIPAAAFDPSSKLANSSVGD